MALQPDYRYTQSAWGRPATADAAAVDAGLRAYMLRVFNWMASGLLLTGIVALVIASNQQAAELFFQFAQTRSGRLVPVGYTVLGWVALLSPLGFMLVLSFGINRLSTGAAQALFWAYCAAMGASLSVILFRYTGVSVATTFFITAGMFAATAAWGYTTGRDLTNMGSLLFMGLIGIMIAGIVNIFVQSSMLHFVISGIGVLVFVGLTAFDAQRIKADYIEMAYAEGTELAAKRSVLDALSMYLNFINLFQFLLQFTGVRQND